MAARYLAACYQSGQRYVIYGASRVHRGPIAHSYMVAREGIYGPTSLLVHTHIHTYIHRRTRTYARTPFLQNITVKNRHQIFGYVGFAIICRFVSLLFDTNERNGVKKDSKMHSPSALRPLREPCIRKWQEGRASFGSFPLLIRWRFGAQRRPGTLTGKKGQLLHLNRLRSLG